MGNITEIGVVRNGMKEKLDPIQFKDEKSTINIKQEYSDGLFGIQENDYITVIFDLHQARNPTSSRHQTRMGEFKGVFASRTPNRPSSVGVTTVKLVNCEENALVVEGLDAIDGTPVLDIKPYTPWFDDAEEKKEIFTSIERRYPRGSIIDKIMTGDREALLYYAGTLHGHYCPGLSLGIHLASYAMKEINEFTDGIMEDLIAIVEMNNCAADGVQYVTGCTFGNNALIFRDFGKMALTLIKRSNGNGIRVALKNGWQSTRKSSPEFSDLARKVIRERSATDEEKSRFKALAREESFKLVNLPSRDILNSRCITLSLPPRAPIHDSFTCSNCGEDTMASRKRIVEDRNLCYECAGIPYTQLTGFGFEEVVPSKKE